MAVDVEPGDPDADDGRSRVPRVRLTLRMHGNGYGLPRGTGELIYDSHRSNDPAGANFTVTRCR